jgi:TonB-dependent starch-binding outer membrane protein SusC
MRLTFYAILLAVIQSYALSGYAQVTKLNLTMKNGAVREVLLEIENMSKFRFLYNSKMVDVERTVSVNFKDLTIDKAMDILFEDVNVDYTIIDRQVVLSARGIPINRSGFVQQQQAAVSGKVTDSDGQPLPGVSIVVKGTTQGTVTNADGEYTLTNIPSDATLVFSFVGMRTHEVVVGNQSVVNVSMEEDVIGLEEVIAVGYGTMRKSDLTGSVVSADVEAFEETSNVNIVQSLQGNVAGLNVGTTTTQGAEPSMSIRGLNTLGGETSPLIVLDDIIYRGRIVDINPADIESVNILKDASASAIYGSQAANGVIIITTKKGTSTDKPVFSYSGSVGFQSPTKLWTPMSREQFLEKNKDVWWRQAYLAPDYIQPNPEWNDLDALVTIHQVEGYNDGTDTDWLSPTIRTGLLNKHNLNMQTKTKNTSYFISLGYTNSDGYVKNDNFDRYSIRLNVDNEILEWFNVGVQSFVTISDYEGRSASLSSCLAKSPLAKSHNEDGSLYLYPDGFLTPLYYQETAQLDEYLTLYGNFYADIDIPVIKGLKYRLDFSPNMRRHRLYTYNPYSLSESGAAEKRYYNNFDYALDNRFNYSKRLGDHSIEATLAAGTEKRIYDYTSAYSGEFAMQGLDWNRLQDGSIEKQSTTTSAWQETSTFQMARLLYNYVDRYLFTGTVRRDGFSGFGKNNKFGIFPSIALAWRMSEEDFLSDIKWLDNGKFRISYGQNGNRTVQRYQTLAKMTSDYTYTFGGSSAMSQTTSTLANPDLKWETTTSFNIGLDFAVINSRINGAIEYYLSSTTDMLYRVDLPVLGGISSTFTNLGEIKNRGLEITLNTININNRNFNWESGIVFSRNRNKIVSLLGIDNDGDGMEDDLVAEGLFIGEPISAIFSYNCLGLYQLDDTDIPADSGPGLYRWEDLNGDGNITAEADRKIIGYSDPGYRWSFKNTFNYKNFSLMVFLNSIQGGKNYYYDAISGPTGGARDDNVRRDNWGVEHAEFWWTPQNPDSPFKELFAYDPVQTHRYFQRSFVRLQDVSLSYEFASSFINQLNFKRLSVFVSGKNLYTWTNWYGLDPETGDEFRTSHPLLRNITLGVNVSF